MEPAKVKWEMSVKGAGVGVGLVVLPEQLGEQE